MIDLEQIINSLTKDQVEFFIKKYPDFILNLGEKLKKEEELSWSNLPNGIEFKSKSYKRHTKKDEIGLVTNEDYGLFFELKNSELAKQRDSQALLTEKVDVTLPGRRTLKGGLHPLTILTNEISDLFIGLGYNVAEGPELESEWLNFDALNIPADHPARTMQDTFFIQPLEAKLVLRTHTSPVQIRTMLEQRPPIYVICPGKTYRADELDATHTPVFHQVEGLVIDEDITMADLKGTLDYFANSIFGNEVTTRLRPSFFPFTEPSAEVDIFFNGRWIEWGGCGMVNEKVLATCGVDTKKYSGFAFGMGLERTLMVKYGITDMHDIVEGDIRFTQSFGVGRK